MRKFGIESILGFVVMGIITFAVVIGLFSGYKALNSNKDFLKVDYTFKKAVIKLPNNEVVTGEVEEWIIFNNKGTVKVKLKNGKQYLGHSSNIVLYND